MKIIEQKEMILSDIEYLVNGFNLFFDSETLEEEHEIYGTVFSGECRMIYISSDWDYDSKELELTKICKAFGINPYALNNVADRECNLNVEGQNIITSDRLEILKRYVKKFLNTRIGETYLIKYDENLNVYFNRKVTKEKETKTLTLEEIEIYGCDPIDGMTLVFMDNATGECFNFWFTDAWEDVEEDDCVFLGMKSVIQKLGCSIDFVEKVLLKGVADEKLETARFNIGMGVMKSQYGKEYKVKIGESRFNDMLLDFETID
ncbi:hypothetical protein [Nostoc sp. CCY 9925]|uniref:hypothetical protein n=1 Tax=Nostoc sp. CCY 9925 TaxID=3103865 RepID=UPI0039C5AA65